MRVTASRLCLAALLSACATQEDKPSPNTLDKLLAEERTPGPVSETDRQLAQVIIVRSQNAALKQGLRDAELAYPATRVEAEIETIDPALRGNIRLEGRSGAIQGGIVGGIVGAPKDRRAEREDAFLSAENRALRDTLLEAGAEIPDHEEWKEIDEVGVSLFAGPRTGEMILARPLADGDVFVTGEFGLTRDEERLIATDETFRAAYRADPRATLDLIRRILGSEQTAQ